MTFGPLGLDMNGMTAEAGGAYMPALEPAQRARVRLSSRRVSWQALAVVEAPILALVSLVVAVSVLVAPGNTVRGAGIELPDLIFCPFLAITHIPCLMCGLTRSFMAMGGLDIRQAFTFHPLGPFLYAAMIGAGIAAAWSLARRRRLKLRLSAAARRALIRYAAAILVAAWLLKLVIWRETGLL